MLMPSAPPVSPREREAIRKNICPMASVSMPKATPGTRTITRPMTNAIKAMPARVATMAASAGITWSCRSRPRA